uniref:Knottin scorpion toxin-like domain-containing protein n=1 Tax=Aegilops tauschii subsp. strangulata TaxID=200361 RepID=A0A453GUI5_AEGTS
MEGKAILLCLMVLAHVGNSIHIDKCKDLVHPQRKTCKDLTASIARECVLLKCQGTCKDLYGAELKASWCYNPVPYYWHCRCRVCW